MSGSGRGECGGWPSGVLVGCWGWWFKDVMCNIHTYNTYNRHMHYTYTLDFANSGSVPNLGDVHAFLSRTSCQRAAWIIILVCNSVFVSVCWDAV